MQIASIQRLRALAALMVVIGHAQTEAIVAAGKSGALFTPLTVLPWGAGVDLFFVISGFIMVVASERLFARPDGAWTFAVRRVARIVPLYWLFTTLYVLIQIATHKRVGGLDLLASYGFWPRDTFGDGVARPLFTLGWTLNYEMFFYALFAGAIRLPPRRAVAVVTAVLAAGVVVGRIWQLPLGPLAFWTQPIVLEFALGMMLGLAWRGNVCLPSAGRFAIATVGLAVLVADMMNAADRPSTWNTPTNLARVGAWGLPSAMLVAAAVLGRTDRTPASRPQPFRFGATALGDASYALYLAHPFVVGTLMRVWTACGLVHLGLWPFVGAAVASSIVVGFATHAWVERPIAGELARKRRGARTALALAGPSVAP